MGKKKKRIRKNRKGWVKALFNSKKHYFHSSKIINKTKQTFRASGQSMGNKCRHTQTQKARWMDRQKDRDRHAKRQIYGRTHTLRQSTCKPGWNLAADGYRLQGVPEPVGIQGLHGLLACLYPQPLHSHSWNNSLQRYSWFQGLQSVKTKQISRKRVFFCTTVRQMLISHVLPPPTPHPKSLVYTCRGLSPLPHDIWPLSAKAHHFTSETVLQYVKSLAGFGQTLSLWCVKVKLTFLELCPIGAFEIEITVCRGQYSFFTGRGLNYSMWKQINFVELGSTWLIILCFTAEENDAFSFFLFSIWRPANQLCKCYLQCNRAIKTFNIIQVS